MHLFVGDVHVVFAAFKPKDELSGPVLPYFSEDLMTKSTFRMYLRRSHNCFQNT